MSRSRRKIAIAGVTTAESDKKCKVQANKKFRRKNKVILEQFLDEKEMKLKNEVSSVWDFTKDGKILHEGYPEILRK
ncbi:MAG: hypothetical protein V1779_14965 [bacterium]